MAATLKLYVDTFTGRLCTSPNSNQSPGTPVFFQGDVKAMQIHLLEPAPTLGTGNYTYPDISNMTLLMAIGSAPTGTVGGPTPIITQFTWTKVGTGGTTPYFTAEVGFNTAGVATLIGTASSATAYMEVQVSEGTAVQTYLQIPITINAELIESGTLAVASVLTPISREEAVAMFVQYLAPNGSTITLPSPDGSHSLIIGCRNDGTVQMDVI